MRSIPCAAFCYRAENAQSIRSSVKARASALGADSYRLSRESWAESRIATVWSYRLICCPKRWRQRWTQTTSNQSPRAIRSARVSAMYLNLKLQLWKTGIRQNRLARILEIDETALSKIVNG